VIRGTYIWGAYIREGLYSGGGAYIWNEVSVSICCGLIFGGGGLYSWGGGAYSQRFTVCENIAKCKVVLDFVYVINGFRSYARVQALAK
jgi:hypothetical protein